MGKKKAWHRAHFPPRPVARLPEPLIALLLAGSLSRNAHPMALCPPLSSTMAGYFPGHFLNPQGIKNPCSLLERIPGGQGQPLSPRTLQPQRRSSDINPPGPWPPSRALEENSLCASVASFAKTTALPHDVGDISTKSCVQHAWHRACNGVSPGVWTSVFSTSSRVSPSMSLVCHL